MDVSIADDWNAAIADYLADLRHTTAIIKIVFAYPKKMQKRQKMQNRDWNSVVEFNLFSFSQILLNGFTSKFILGANRKLGLGGMQC
jgi:hypothetical protein